MKDKIVVDGVTYFREAVSISQEVSAKAGNYDWLTGEIYAFYEEAVRLYTNMQYESFTVGMIESEGYLRAMKTIVNKIKEIEDSNQVKW